MSDNRNLDTNKLSELRTHLVRVSNLAEYLGAASISNGKGGYTEGTGLKGELGKLQGLLRWADKDNGRSKLQQQARDAGQPFMDYLISWKLRQNRQINAKQAEIKETMTLLVNATKALNAWEADNPNYKGLDLDFVESMLTDDGPTSTRVTEDLQTMQATDDLESDILARVLNSKI